MGAWAVGGSGPVLRVAGVSLWHHGKDWVRSGCRERGGGRGLGLDG